MLPVAQRYGMGTLVWSPLAGGLLTGRYRKGEQASTHRAGPRPSSSRASAADPPVNARPPDRIPSPLSHGGQSYRTSRPVMARPMIRRWISEVPSKMVKIFASRCQRSTGNSRV